ncbi:MAG: hypothetical protein IJ932_04690 [Ruminococcus sp.]|nr:hypothetical protein [Ruminococcus sp.]
MFNNPPMCGGTSKSYDENAPKEIKSEDMTLFKIETALTPMGVMVGSQGAAPVKTAWFRFISVYAAKCESGVFVLFYAHNRNDKKEFGWSYIKDDIFPELVSAVNNYNLAKSNGSHSFTYGLPENFGGEVRVDYSSGERIDFSTNRNPVISVDFAVWLYDFFSEALKKDSVELPDASKIKTIRFDSKRSGGGYTHIVLTQNGDVCSYSRERKFDFPDIYKDEKELPSELMDKFRGIINDNAMSVWHMLPENGFDKIEEKSMTFVFDDGTEIEVPSDRVLSSTISGAFFNIELELDSNN